MSTPAMSTTVASPAPDVAPLRVTPDVAPLRVTPEVAPLRVTPDVAPLRGTSKSQRRRGRRQPIVTKECKPADSGPHAMVKDFATPGWRAETSVIMSAYGAMGAVYALDKLGLPANYRVLNIAYRLGPGYNQTGNGQLFLTGTIEHDEAPINTCMREIAEEIHMKPANSGCLIYLGVKVIKAHKRPPRVVTWFACHADNLVPTTPRKPLANRGYDKISCVIFGSTKDMAALLDRIPPVTSNDNVAGAICLSVADMRKIVDLTRREYRHLEDKFYWRADGSHALAFSSRYAPDWLLASRAT